MFWDANFTIFKAGCVPAPTLAVYHIDATPFNIKKNCFKVRKINEVILTEILKIF